MRTGQAARWMMDGEAGCMVIALAVGLLLLVATLRYNVLSSDPEMVEAALLLGIAIVLIGLFFFIRSKRRGDRDFLTWLSANRVAIERGGAHYGGALVQPDLKLTRFTVVVSLLLVSLKLPSRFYIVGHHPTPLFAATFALMSFVLGWWGFPSGPIYTIQAIWSNLRGGMTCTVREVLLQPPA